MDNLIIIGISLVIVGAAIHYIWKEKKNGVRCVGCPSSGHCMVNTYGEVKGKCDCHTSSN